jgi:calcineurin-like phosphoesterase family protein
MRVERGLALGLWLLCAGCSFVGSPWSAVDGCDPTHGNTLTARPDSPPLTRFVALGDFGTDAGGRNAQVAATLHQFIDAVRQRPERVFELGDNFYETGLIGKDVSCREVPGPPAALRTQAMSVLGPYEFLRDARIPFTAVAGNHDHGCGRVGLENEQNVDRWLPPDHRWGDRWEVLTGLPKEVALGSDAVQVIAIDSHRMITENAFREESARVLEQLLVQGRQRYRWHMVIAHHPLRSYGTHGGAWWEGSLIEIASILLFPSHALAALHVPPFDGLNQQPYSIRYSQYRRAVEEAIRRSKVPVALFLGGHEHQLQLLKPDAEGQPYVVVSGSAANCDPVGVGPLTVFAAPKNGFVAVSVYADALLLEFVATTGCSDQEACAAATQPRPHVLFRIRIPPDATGPAVRQDHTAADRS